MNLDWKYILGTLIMVTDGLFKYGHRHYKGRIQNIYIEERRRTKERKG